MRFLEVGEEPASISGNEARREGARIEETKRPLSLDTILLDICYCGFSGKRVGFMTLSWTVTCCHFELWLAVTRSQLRLVVPISGEKQLDVLDLISLEGWPRSLRAVG